MPATFSRTLNALKSDDPRRRLVWLAAGVGVMGAWLGWFVLAEVPVFESTPAAHLEVSGQAHPVEAPVGGRVVRVRMELGQEVAPGDVLVELDAELARDPFWTEGIARYEVIEFMPSRMAPRLFGHLG